MRLTGKLSAIATENHPDVSKGTHISFRDTYTFDREYSREEAIRYMKRDLAEVLSGGIGIQNTFTNAKFELL